MTHDLKCWPIYFQMVDDLMKQFEIREIRDRTFSAGDTLLLREWDPASEQYTGRECRRLVTYAMTDPAFVKPGFVVMSLARL
jgi:hypothetical protein